MKTWGSQNRMNVKKEAKHIIYTLTGQNSFFVPEYLFQS